MNKQHFIFILFLLSLFINSSCFHEGGLYPTVKVFKYDKSVQCGNTGITLDEMAMELINAGIDVICQQKGHDGLFYATACGIGTGNINIYTIPAKNLIDAQNISFSPVGELDNYQDEVCAR